MYAIYANIGSILMVNVTIYTIHGSYGYFFVKHPMCQPMGMCQAGSRRAPLHLAEAEVLVPPFALSLSLEMMVNYRDYMGLLWNSMDMYGWMWRRMGIPYFIPQSIGKWINPDKSGLVEESNMEKTWWLDGFREQFIPTLGCRLTQMYRQWIIYAWGNQFGLGIILTSRETPLMVMIHS